ncbi:preprotein translocase subunit SecE [Olsenella sp. An270]|uniref:preprotein translocase subunit SecE n=1 Tax=Olsenella sp. An270 TaxID=1965615 RepID=UPI000B381D81|nr:preprotein translocase subunit SecE [Olsenella sp. An270]OUO59442.1 preprotein translocase subunit SecE [Olsenella sp. An270]
MANKDRNKRSARKARAEERARVEAAQAATTGSQPAKAVAKAEKKPVTKPEKKKADKKPGIFRRLLNYLGDVRSEMRRVVWPSPEELKSYSVAIVAMLIVFGIVIWLVDSGIVAALVGYTGLRG